MVDRVDAALTFFPEVVPTLSVDDLALEQGGNEEQLVASISGFAQSVMKRIEEDGMEVNLVKSLISASQPSPMK